MSLVVNSWTGDTAHSLFLLFYLFDPVVFPFMVQWTEDNNSFAHFGCSRCVEFFLQCVSTCRRFFFLQIWATVSPSVLYLCNAVPSRGIRKWAEDLGFIGCGDCSWMCLAALSSVPQPEYSSSQKHRRSLEASAAVCTTQLHQITARLLSQ